MNAYNTTINWLTKAAGQDVAIRFLEEFIDYQVGHNNTIGVPEYRLFHRDWESLNGLINDMTWSRTRSGEYYWDHIYEIVFESEYDYFNEDKIVLIGNKERVLVCTIGDTIIYEMEHTTRKNKDKLAKIERT